VNSNSKSSSLSSGMGNLDEDLRDGFVYFGCKKSIKVPLSSADPEQTTTVSVFLLSLSFTRNVS
jgi:hypothetical protein